MERPASRPPHPLCPFVWGEESILRVALLASPFPPTPTPTPGPVAGGLTQEPCKEDADCQLPRSCVGFPYNGTHGGAGAPPPGSAPPPDLPPGPPEPPQLGVPHSCEGSDCACYPRIPQTCASSAECVSGETCVALAGFGQYCASAAMERDLPQLGEVASLTNGWTMDTCTSDKDCRDSRECLFLELNSPVASCAGRDGCRCLPRDLQTCRTRKDCAKGEVCSSMVIPPDSSGLVFPKEIPQEQLINGTSPSSSFRIMTMCASRRIAYMRNGFISVYLDREGLGYKSEGLTLETCREDKDCQGERKCRSVGFPGLYEFCGARDCPPVAVCVPSDLQVCQMDIDCDDGEVCALFGTGDEFCISGAVADIDDNVLRTDFSEEPSSVTGEISPSVEATSTEVEQSTSPTSSAAALESTSEEAASSDETGSEVCVDARALTHLRREELVFEKDSIARVLCDSDGSCATKGHMVIFRGQAMIMGGYCAMVGCSVHVMRVNSPRYRLGARLTSRTERLQYTALAARYATRAEEMVLQSVIRAGM